MDTVVFTQAELTLSESSDDFVFDNEILAQCVHAGFHIGEILRPAEYFGEASSINLRRSITYGLGWSSRPR